MSTWADSILSFQKKLNIELELPLKIEVMNPYQDKRIASLCQIFYKKFYSDNMQRTMILGINPGRFGGGLTGIPFTDPVALASLGISNELPKKRELSSEFVYFMIEHVGGAKVFYQRFYISSVSPLGFIQEGKNLNYYDVKGLPNKLKKFMVGCLVDQLSWGLNKDVCFCLGEGENFKFIKKLNTEFHFFKEVIPLPHPRFIMQYRRKRMNEYIRLYKEKLALTSQ